MRHLVCLIVLSLMLSACGGMTAQHAGDSFSYFEKHCREHASDLYGEDSEELRFEECMATHGFANVPENDAHLQVGTQ